MALAAKTSKKGFGDVLASSSADNAGNRVAPPLSKNKLDDIAWLYTPTIADTAAVLSEKTTAVVSCVGGGPVSTNFLHDARHPSVYIAPNAKAVFFTPMEQLNGRLLFI